jgi:hypothetical protein
VLAVPSGDDRGAAAGLGAVQEVPQQGGGGSCSGNHPYLSGIAPGPSGQERQVWGVDAGPVIGEHAVCCVMWGGCGSSDRGACCVLCCVGDVCGSSDRGACCVLCYVGVDAGPVIGEHAVCCVMWGVDAGPVIGEHAVCCVTWGWMRVQ